MLKKYFFQEFNHLGPKKENGPFVRCVSIPVYIVLCKMWFFYLELNFGVLLIVLCNLLFNLMTAMYCSGNHRPSPVVDGSGIVLDDNDGQMEPGDIWEAQSTNGVTLSRTDNGKFFKSNPYDAMNEYIDRINIDLAYLSSWSKRFGLKLNTEKTQSIIIGHSRLLSTIDNNNMPVIMMDNTPIPYNFVVKKLKCLLWLQHELEYWDKTNK